MSEHQVMAASPGLKLLSWRSRFRPLASVSRDARAREAQHAAGVALVGDRGEARESRRQGGGEGVRARPDQSGPGSATASHWPGPLQTKDRPSCATKLGVDGSVIP